MRRNVRGGRTNVRDRFARSDAGIPSRGRAVRGRVARRAVLAVATATTGAAVLAGGVGPATATSAAPATAADAAASVPTGAVPAPNARTGAPIPSAGSTQQVTLYLAAPDPSGLVALAHAHAMPVATRAARLARLLPQAGPRVTVENQLRALGLTVTGTSTWSVTATAPAGRIRALFGSARATRPDLPFAQGLPTLPRALGALVTTAVGGDEVRPAFRSFAHAAPPTSTTTSPGPGATAGRSGAAIPAAAGYTGPQIATAYGAPNGARADGGPEPTIATLQLAGWHPADLTTYARAAGQPDPVASGRYTAVGIGRTQTYDPAVDGDGDAEVALDQETILGVAPHARQRAYFAPNTDAGFLAVLDRVRTDAAAPNSKIVALSTSWGLCERFNTPAVVQTTETLLAALAAAGVTPLAASGDAGSGDCGDGGTDVDYPASSAYAVAVGGTSLRDPTGTPVETAWSGSGGGCSRLFARPSWQPATACGTRAVPDVAGPADPGHGYAVYDARYWSVHGGSGPAGWVRLGGTSLAAPSVAAMLADTWATRNQTVGYGEIHPALYSAAAPTFRDETSGSNGGYRAGVGYDLVTGRGSPLWNRLGPLLRPGPAAGYALAAGIGTDQAVWVLRGSASTFTSLGGVATSAPATVTVNDTALEIVGGRDRNLWVRSDARGWAPLGPAGTVCSGPAAVVTAGLLHVGCRAADGSLLVGVTTVHPDGAVDRMTAWTSYGGQLTGAPAAGLVRGVVTWFATIGPATVANLASRTAITGWHPLAARCTGAPGAGTSRDGTVSYVGCRTATGSTIWARTPFATFSDAGGRETGEPGFAVRSDGTADVFVIGTDRGLWTTRLNPAAPAAGWSNRGGVLIAGMGAAQVGG